MKIKLLKSNLSTFSLNLSLDIISFSLRNVLFDYLRSALYEILCFLKSKTCDLTNNLDNLNLVSTNLCKLNVELSLLFSTCCASFNSRTVNSLIASIISAVDNFAIFIPPYSFIHKIICFVFYEAMHRLLCRRCFSCSFFCCGCFSCFSRSSFLCCRSSFAILLCDLFDNASEVCNR